MFRNSLRTATPLALVAGVSMSTSAFQVSAAEVSFQFTAELYGIYYVNGSSGFANLFGIGDTLSGSLTYDTDLAPYYQDTNANGTYSSFDFLSAPSLTSSLFVSELSHTFQLEAGNLGIYTDGSGESFDLSTAMENVASLQNEQINVGLYLGDNDGGLLSTTDTLPSDIDFNLVDYGEFYVYGSETEAYAEITAFFLDIGNDQEPTVDPDGNLILGATQSELFTLETGELLQTNKTTVGLFEDSTFVHQAGTHTTAELLVGGDANEIQTGQGSYLLQSGTLNSGHAQVGAYGEGSFVQSGGTHNAEWIMIGNVGQEGAFSGPVAIGIGEYVMTDGTLNVGLSGMTVGGHGQGSFSQSGGDVVIGSSFTHNPNLGQLRIGTGPSQYDPGDFVIPPAVQRGGSYTLDNGTLTVYGNTILGSGSDFSGHNYGGRGEFNQSGGTVFIRDRLVVGEAGDSASGTGQYVISGGSLTVGSDLQVADNYGGGNAAEGLFFQTGGNVDVSGNIIIGESATILPNAYTIRGGSTTAHQVEVGFGGTAPGQAVLEVSNGGLLTGNVFVNGNGVLTGDGGTIDGAVTLNGGTLAPGSSPGTMNILGDLFLIGGSVELEVGPGLFDQIIVGGSVQFGGDVLIDLIFDSDPFETAFDLTGLFDVTGDIVFDSGFSLADSLHIAGLDAGTSLLITLFDQQFTYDASPVPIPAAAWLLGSGLLGLVGVGRRRQTHLRGHIARASA